MRKILSVAAISVAWSSGSVAENCIINSSFELGRAEYGIHRFIRSGVEGKFIEPVCDTAEKIHGKQSLRFNNPNADAIELFTREYKLDSGKTYTFSFYMKSSKKINIRAGQFAGEIINYQKGDWGLFSTKYFQIGKTWKRYSFSFEAKGQRGWYFTQFRWGNNNGIANNATVWIDAIQVNEGEKVLNYTPIDPVEAAICGDLRVRIRGKVLPCEFRAVNYSNQDAELKAEMKVSDTMFPEKKFALRKLKINVPAGTVVNKAVETNTGCYGHFKLSGNYIAAGRKQPLGAWFFAEIPQYDKSFKYDVKKDSVTGINSSIGRSGYRNQDQIPASFLTMNGSSVQTFGKFLQDTGIKLLRVHGGGFEWKYMEPAPVKFDWTDSDKMVDFADSYGMKLIPVLGNMFYLRDRNGKKRNGSSLPDWLLKSPATVRHPLRGVWDGISPDPAAWKRFVTAVVARYKGRIPAYEITNEPNIALPGAKEYIPYLISSGKIIKKYDPSAAVVGGSITTDLGGKTDKFLNEMGSSGSLKYCDAVSFHPYSSPLASSPSSAVSAIKGLRRIADVYSPGIALWNTELYYIGPAPSAFYAAATRATHAQHLLRRNLIDMGENVKQSLIITDGQLLINELIPHWELGDTWGHNGYVPHDLYVGLSIASFLLNGTVPVKTFHWPFGACGYIYKKRDGRMFAAVWSGIKKQKFTLNLPTNNIKLYDMFMNPIKNSGTLKLSDYPVYVFGKDLDQLKLETQQAAKVGQAFMSLENGKKVLNLEIINTSAGDVELAVRPDFMEKPQIIKLGVNKSGIVKFRNFDNVDTAKSLVYIADDKKKYQSTVTGTAKEYLPGR